MPRASSSFRKEQTPTARTECTMCGYSVYIAERQNGSVAVCCSLMGRDRGVFGEAVSTFNEIEVDV